MALIIRQTFARPISGFWDGGPKRIFEWSIDALRSTPTHAVVGSWDANHWFKVKRMKTERQILGIALRRLKKTSANYSLKTGNPVSFEYVEVGR